MDERFVISFDLDRGDGQNRKELERVSFTGKVLVYSKDTERMKTFVKQNFEFCMIYVKAVESSVQDVVSLLDVGAAKALITLTQLHEIVEKRLLVEHLERLTVELSHTSAKQAQDELNLVNEASSRIGVHVKEAGWGNLTYPNTLTRKYVSYALDSSATLDGIQKAIAQGYAAILPSSAIAKDRTTNGTDISLGSLVLSGLASDREDGLFPTIVVNERGTSLGLVYSNLESVKESLNTGRGVYWSRKRGLWPKGESSGDIQELVRIDVDCDGDTLQFVVRQKGDGD